MSEILRRFRLILRCTFGLNFVGFENPVGAEMAVGERLSASFKRIRQRVVSVVRHFQVLSTLFQNEGHPATIFQD